MGSFDTLHVYCPSCGEQLSFQSKAHFCQLNQYTVRDVPPAIAGDLDGEVQNCPGCGKDIEILTQFMITARIK